MTNLTATDLIEAALIEMTTWPNPPIITRETDHNGNVTLTIGNRAFSLRTEYNDEVNADDTLTIWGWTWMTEIRDAQMICDCEPIEGWTVIDSDSSQNAGAIYCTIYAWLALPMLQ